MTDDDNGAGVGDEAGKAIEAGAPATAYADPGGLGEGRAGKATYRAGTLAYTGMGLLAVCFWLLWGDFCFTIMETVAIKTVQFKLKNLGATAFALGLITMSIPQLVNFLITPIISFKSDRHRGKWGRRIPFLLGATPFVVLMLIAMGSAEAIGRWVHGVAPGTGSEAAATIFSIGLLMVTFQVANMFINTIYYYLFNDVVPPAMLGRFMALFRIVGTIANAVFYGYIYSRSDSHFQVIFVVAAVVYGVVFTMMCLFVKEGSYAPAPPIIGKSANLVGILRTYKEECLNHRLYWLFLIANALWMMGTSVLDTYNQFMAQECWLTPDEFGKLSQATLIITAILVFPGGWLSDRFHPLRILIVSLWMSLIALPISMVFLCVNLPRDASRWVYTISQFILLPGTAIYLASTLPMFMRVLPRSRYGQYSAANAAFRAVLVALVGVAMGPFLDRLGGLLTPNPSSMVVMPASMKAQWRFDGSVGQAGAEHADSEGVWKGNPVLTAGKIGKALQLDGSGQYVQVANGDDVNIPGNGFSCAGWFKSAEENWGSTQSFLYKGDSYKFGGVAGTRDIQFSLFIGGGWRTLTYANSGDISSRWHHYAATYDGKQMILWLDGTSVKSMAQTGSIAASDGDLFVGRNGSECLRGGVDDVRIYSAALTQADVLHLSLSNLKYLLVPVWVFLCLGGCLVLMTRLWKQVKMRTDKEGRYHPPCVEEVM